MPVDKNGNTLSRGDLVTVQCRVVSVAENEGYSNLTIETVEPYYPAANLRHLAVNTRQVEKLTDEQLSQGQRISALERENADLRAKIVDAEKALASSAMTLAAPTNAVTIASESAANSTAVPSADAGSASPTKSETAATSSAPSAQPPVAEAATDVDGEPVRKPGVYPGRR